MGEIVAAQRPFENCFNLANSTAWREMPWMVHSREVSSLRTALLDLLNCFVCVSLMLDQRILADPHIWLTPIKPILLAARASRSWAR